jgi:hypothetical protein
MAWYKVLVPLLPLGVITGCGSWGGAAMLITLGGGHRCTSAPCSPQSIPQDHKSTSRRRGASSWREARRRGSIIPMESVRRVVAGPLHSVTSSGVTFLSPASAAYSHFMSSCNYQSVNHARPPVRSRARYSVLSTFFRKFLGLETYCSTNILW